MKKKLLVLLVGLSMHLVPTYSQTFTMGKKCRAQNDSGIGLLKVKQYQQALDVFTAMSKSCTTKDAKEAWAVGQAQALNGLGKYNEAITASDAALKVTRNKSLIGYFEKAVAQYRLKQYDAAKASFAKVLELTEKNQDTKTRANNYALMAELYWRQMNQKDSANYYLEKAMTMDSSNANFVIQKGDMCFSEKKYDDAFAQYDKAVSMGKADLEMYTIRSNARMKMMQDKYGTTNAQELRSKMTATEKNQLCVELKKAISLGLHDMKQDMFASLVCK